MSFKREKVFLFLGIVAFLGVAFRAWMYIRDPIDHNWGKLTPCAFDPLVLGAAAYMVWDKVRIELSKTPFAALLLASIGAAITLRVIWVFDERMVNMIFTPLLIGIGCAMFLIGACSLPRRWEFMFKPWAWVGGLSYGLYLLHISVFCFLAPYLYRIYSYEVGAAIYFSVSIGIAWLCYRFYEMPANRWICKCFGVTHSTLKQQISTGLKEAEIKKSVGNDLQINTSSNHL